jgi:hypothetical protein
MVGGPADGNGNRNFDNMTIAQGPHPVHVKCVDKSGSTVLDQTKDIVVGPQAAPVPFTPAPAAAPTQGQLSGAYTFFSEGSPQLGGGTGTWHITPFAGALHVESLDRWDGYFNWVGNKWVMDVQHPNSQSCNGNQVPATLHYSMDPASLQGTVFATWDCGGPQRTEPVDFNLTKDWGRSDGVSGPAWLRPNWAVSWLIGGLRIGVRSGRVPDGCSPMWSIDSMPWSG